MTERIVPGGRRRKEERQQRILGELRVHPSIRVSEIARRLGVHVEPAGQAA